MNNSSQQQREIKRLLDTALEHRCQDVALKESLHRARTRAIGQQRPWLQRHYPALSLSLAAGLFLLAVLPILLPKDNPLPTAAKTITPQDLELISQLENFEQEMAFYDWLEQNDATSG
ncbi:MAG: hypothetical protein P8101_02400 [Candidatus Thiodiazotropha sp.]|jgi:hypothetical protein